LDWDIQLLGQEKGEYDGSQVGKKAGKFNTGFVDMIEGVWRRVIAADMAVNGRWEKPRLVCRQVKRRRFEGLAPKWEGLRAKDFKLGSHAVNPPREVIIDWRRVTRVEIPLEY
jgi:hypothetical protein